MSWYRFVPDPGCYAQVTWRDPVTGEIVRATNPERIWLEDDDVCITRYPSKFIREGGLDPGEALKDQSAMTLRALARAYRDETGKPPPGNITKLSKAKLLAYLSG